MINGINRGLQWIKKVLEITEVATVPTQVLPEVRPTLDLFGWERLGETENAAFNNAAPATSIVTGTSFAVDDGSVRYIINMSGQHTDTGVPHTVWMTKRGTSGGDVGLPLDRTLIDPLENASMIGNTWIFPGESVAFRTDLALVAGIIQINIEFIDVPIGEYIPHL